MTQWILFLQQHGAEILQGLSMIVAGASVLANFTKTDKDDKALGFASKTVNALAANFFKLGKK
ncbi:MAG: hypothetical protein OXT65_08675 [Alphaproteobacteria bacterium]|nr:hypothetical protein [Alphaproteobacteria bacterium]